MVYKLHKAKEETPKLALKSHDVTCYCVVQWYSYVIATVMAELYKI